MTKFLSLLISGGATGAIFAIMASGLVLTYETSGIFNFAHGAVAFAVALLYFELHTGLHWPIVPAALVSVCVFAPLLGLGLNRIMLSRLAMAPVYARIVGTIGLLVALPNLALLIVQQVHPAAGNPSALSQVYQAPGLGPTPAHTWTLLKGLVLDSDTLAIFAAALLTAVALWYILHRTRLGLLMRADVDRRELARLRGVDTGRISAITWTLTMMLAGLGGVLLAPLFGLNSNFTYTLVVLGSMAAIVFARLRSVPLAFVGGLALGIIANMVAGYGNSFIPKVILGLSGFRTSIPFILTLVGLIVLNQSKGRATGSAASEAPPPDHRLSLPEWRRRLPWALVTVGLVAYTLLGADTYWSGLLAQGLVFAVIFLSFVVVTGIGGMVNLAQAGFVTTGAFVTGWLLKHSFSSTTPVLMANGHLNFVIAVAAAAVVAAVVGAVIALPVRRLGTLELALGTLAIAFVADQVIFPINAIRNSSDGYLVTPPSIGPIHFSDARSLVILLLVVFGLLTVVVTNLQRSASGRAIFAARSSDVAARTSGLSPDRAKVAVFAVSAAIAGVAGALYALVSSPFTNTTTPAISGLIWLAVVVTFGIRRPAGALIGGLTYGVGNAIFTKITGHSGSLHSVVSSAYFLPILFGLGAINLAKSPDGTLALSARQWMDLRRRWQDRRTPFAAGRTGGPQPVILAPSPEATGTATVPDAGLVPAADQSPLADPAAGAAAGGHLETEPPAPVLRLEGIHAAYGEIEVIHGLDLSLAPGSILALLGSNGAGKSTLCAVAAGLLTPSEGRVILDGEDITDHPAHRRARDGVLLAPEARGVFPGLTVEENLAVWLPGAAARDRAYEHFPVLGERRRQRAGLLSGGEQQMLALAGALVQPPRVFIADEPTLELAPLAAAAVCRTLDRLRDLGTSILLVEEKSADVLDLADTVALMQLGRVVWAGPRSELSADSLTSAYLGGERVLST